MQHHFNVEIAQKHGVDAAIMLDNIHYWVQHAKANNNKFHDGKHWTYNSLKAFTELFPYWSTRQIERILKKLEDENLILTGNYNANTHDRKKWYTLTDLAESYYKSLICLISPNGEMHNTKRGNASHKTVKWNSPNGEMLINNTDNKPDNKHYIYPPTPNNSTLEQNPENKKNLGVKKEVEVEVESVGHTQIGDKVFLGNIEQHEKTTAEIIKEMQEETLAQKMAVELTLAMIESLNIEFTNNELLAIKAHAKAKPNRPPHIVKANLISLYDWAQTGLDIYSSLWRSHDTKVLVQPFMSREFDNKNNRLSIADVVKLRQETIAREKQERASYSNRQ